MNRTFLLIFLGLGFIILLAGGGGYFLFRQQMERQELLAAPPAQGTKILCELEVPLPPGNTNLIGQLREATRKRFATLHLRVHFAMPDEKHVELSTPSVDSQLVQQAEKSMSQPGRLEFRLVHENTETLVESGQVPTGYEVLEQLSSAGATSRVEKLVIQKESEGGLTGNLIKSAAVMRANSGESEIGFRLNAEAAERFANVTRQNVGRRLAIIVDGRVWSAPRIVSPIDGGAGMIQGMFTPSEAASLAAALESPLPVKISRVESKPY